MHRTVQLSQVLFLAAAAIALLLVGSIFAPAAETVAFDRQPDRLVISIDAQPFATYVWRDPEILRPYFAQVHAPSGQQVTRNHPPVQGKDPTDHATMHPGVWLAFGDLSGADFWRNKGRVEQVRFTEQPAADEHGGQFAVENRYVASDKTICQELRRIRIRPRGGGWLIVWDSTFSGPDDFYFGDQEEMGLGIRVATPLAVKNGGRMTNSDGLQNEKQVWGKQADWCDYSGAIDGQAVGV